MRITKRIIQYLVIGAVVLLPMVHAGSMNNLRNQRYCEVLLKTGHLSLSVYNTIGLNHCPDLLWSQLNSKQIGKIEHTSFVYLNGPRYWVIDGMKNTRLVNPSVKNFGGIDMREAGIVQLKVRDLLHPKNKPYHIRTIHRETTWVYKANQPIYELINSEGKVFIMQSYSIAKRPQTIESLAQLGAQLQLLPKGWRFCSEILPQTIYVTAQDKEAVVIQDEFLNTYQAQIDPSVLNQLQCVNK